MGRRSVLSILGLAAASCHAPVHLRSEHSASANEQTRAEPPLVVLVAIDGVRWQDVYHGPTRTGAMVAQSREELVPQLTEMERNGATWGEPSSAEFHASGPNFVSLPGYMEMLSGTSSTGCTENDCKRIKRHTLLDDFLAHTPNDPTRAAAFSSWPDVSVAASKEQRGVVSTGRFAGYGHELLEAFDGCRSALHAGRAEGGGHAGFRWDALTARLALAFLNEARPDFMFVSLGESDEKGHAGDYPNYLRAIQRADAFVGSLRHDLKEIREGGRETLLLVTTDHGRAHNFSDHGRKHPESSRSWLFAEGDCVRGVGPLQGDRAYLKDIAPTVRAVTGLPARLGSGSGRVLHEIFG